MKILFHTSLDAKYAYWKFPKEVCCRPEIGDYVKPINDDQELKVHTITHCYGQLSSSDLKIPYLKIELIKK